uniref:Uncharacterized protein n=1 Tax=Helianthus annuus TaxID=4232 RepID=A0A251VIU0_HELAN
MQLMRKQSLCLLIQQPILCSTKATDDDGGGYPSDRLAGSGYKNIDRYVFFDSSNDFYWKLFEARSYCSQVTTIRNATSFTRFIVTKNINKTALQRFDSYIHGNCVEDGP